MAPVELLILGGGCAGLSLARELAARGWREPTMIIETRPRYTNDRSWCFWAREEEPMTRLASARWEQWRYSSADGRSVDHRVPGLHYHYVASDDFYRDALDRIAQCENMTVQLDTPVEDGCQAGPPFSVTTRHGTIAAHRVIDTRPPSIARLQSAELFQCFAGEILKVDRLPAGMDNTAGLMCGLQSDATGLRFDYVLPLDTARVLIEATRFSIKPLAAPKLEADLDHLRARLGLADCPVEHRERSVLPMGLPAPKGRTRRGWIRAGLGGGALRPATGYAFMRIQHWARDCAARLVAGRQAVGHPPDSALQRWMDHLFLAVIRRQPEQSAGLFMRLAEGVPPGILTRFLSDRASLSDRLAIIRALPARPFLAQLFRPG